MRYAILLVALMLMGCEPLPAEQPAPDEVNRLVREVRPIDGVRCFYMVNFPDGFSCVVIR